ncbi:MAG: hypothetical protein ACD_54C00824G0001 [uncultured bacterium]|nr:MAG: hypothetical protein ACD_54C00824G0001 [uncultured bacterium]
MNKRQHFLGLGIALGAGHALDHQPVGDVVAHVHVREQRVVLKHRVDIAQMWRGGGNVLTEDADFPGGWRFKAGNQPQAGGFAGTGRAKHGKERALGNGQIHRIDGFHRGRGGAEMARDGAEFYCCGHG